MKFRMVDKILQWQSGRELYGVKTVSFEEYQLKAPFGGDAHLPESLLLECLIQSCNWLIVLSSNFERIGIIKEYETVRFLGQFRPGQTLSIEVQTKRYDDQFAVFDVQGRIATEPIVQVDACMFEPVSLAEYCDPVDLRVLYAEIGPITPDYSMKNHVVKP